MGTPAFPTAANVAIRAQPIIEAMEKEIPWDILMKSTVTKMKAAQPFMLITEQRGKPNRASGELIPSLLSASSIVRGNVEADDLEKKAVTKAGDIAFAVLIAERRCTLSRQGKTISPWIKLAPTMHSRYLLKISKLSWLWLASL